MPMALYKHVADKDELLDGMVDVVIDEFAPPDPALDWKDGVRQRLLSARRAVLRHPWARRAIESRTRRTPAVLGYMDSVAGMFIAGGFSADLTHHVMHALGNRIWGFSPELFDESQGEPDSSPEAQLDPAQAAEFAQRYPHILEIAMAATGGSAPRRPRLRRAVRVRVRPRPAARRRRAAARSGWSSADRARNGPSGDA